MKVQNKKYGANITDGIWNCSHVAVAAVKYECDTKVQRPVWMNTASITPIPDLFESDKGPPQKALSLVLF